MEHQNIQSNKTFDDLLREGNALLNIGLKYQEAIGFCNKAIEVNPNYDECLNNNWNALDDLGTDRKKKSQVLFMIKLYKD